MNAGKIKQAMTDHKNSVIVASTIALIAIACVFAVYLRLYTSKELWYEMFAAIIGVIITAIITMILLVGQTDSDEKREKKGKVFEEKLRIYQEYLNTLYDVIKDGRNTNEEKLKLAFKTSSIAIHCAPERISRISKNVNNIFKLAINSNGNALENLGNNSWKELLDELFQIMDEFRMDLYQDFKEKSQPKDRTIMLDNFTKAFSNDKDDMALPTNIVNELNNSEQKVEVDIADWENKLNEGRKLKWKLDNYLKERGGFMFVLPDTNTESFVDVGWYEGHYYIQASYLRDPNFAKALKSKYGGKRRYGTWWKYLENEYYNIPEEDLYDYFCKDEGLRKYLFDWVENLMDIIEREHKVMQWLDEVGPCENWTMFVWEWNTLACDYNNEEFGKPYFDVKRNVKNGKIIIELSNRTEQPQLVKHLIQNLEDYSSLILDNDGNCVLEELDENVCNVPQKVKEWMERIEKGTKGKREQLK